jgi:hypothetical protein
MFVRNSNTFPFIICVAVILVCAESGLGQSPQMYDATGRVIDALTLQPLAGARFVYGQPATSIDNGGFVSFAIGRTDSAGEFRLRHLKPGPLCAVHLVERGSQRSV